MKLFKQASYGLTLIGLTAFFDTANAQQSNSSDDDSTTKWLILILAVIVGSLIGSRLRNCAANRNRPAQDQDAPDAVLLQDRAAAEAEEVTVHVTAPSL